MMQFMQAGGYPNIVPFSEENDQLMFDERRCAPIEALSRPYLGPI